MSNTPSVKENTKRGKKVKRVRRHYKKVLRRIVQDLREVQEVLK